jgi:hypothetical protein
MCNNSTTLSAYFLVFIVMHREYLVRQGIAPRNHIKENKIKIKLLQHQAHQTKPSNIQEKNITKTKTKTNVPPKKKPNYKETVPPLPLHLLVLIRIFFYFLLFSSIFFFFF